MDSSASIDPEGYVLHRLAKVLFWLLLIATFALSWWFVFAPARNSGPWMVVYPGDPNYSRQGTAHFVIGDETKWDCAAAYPGAKHCPLHYMADTRSWWPSDDGTGELMTERFKIYVDQPVSTPESILYTAFFTVVTGLLLWQFYSRVILYVAFGRRRRSA